ncbi:sugar isomerase domain-containing protein [Microbispora sp. CA-102843]|uniref:sugar isomerase domain-containing protein n=1 Tax=Microbispora sp. CA-102843 TaxID=3239952 RepID=UPI003D8F52C0
MSAIDAYFTGLLDRLGGVARTQAEAVGRAADLSAAAIAGRGTLYLHDTGHMVSHELFYRTGGLPAFKPLDTAKAPEAPTPADVLFAVSVSGVSAAVVDLALNAREAGVPVVALTAVAFSRALDARHPSGRCLADVADVVLDNGAGYGDAFLDVPGVERPVCPLSGVANAALMWAVTAGTVERLVAAGLSPSVYPSINVPDGPALVAAVETGYAERGH